MQSLTDSVLEFIRQQPEWAFVLVVLVAFLESMAVVGVLVPGWLFLVGIGSLVGGGYLSFYEMSLAMFIGAVIGEGGSYHLGYHYREHIRHWSWFERHQKALIRADAFMREFGVLSLIVGRFIGPVRALLPVVAGIAGMSRRLFWGVNIGSAILWAPLYLVPGMLLGATLTLPEGSRGIMAIFLMSEIFFLWLAQHWWFTAKKRQSESRRLKFQSFLACVCVFMILIIFSLSPMGRQVLQIMLQVFEVVN